MPSSPAAKKVTKQTIDFSNVTDRGGPAAHVPAGDYLLRVEDAEIVPTRDGTSKNVVWRLKIAKGPGRGTIYHRNNLKPQSLWSLRQFLMDLLDKEIPRKALALDFSQFVGKTVGAYLDDAEPYTNPETGKTTVSSEIKETFPASRFEEVAGSEDAGDAETEGVSSLNGFSADAGDDAVTDALEDADEEIEPLEVDSI